MGPKIMGQNKMLVIIDYNMGNIRSVAKAFELLNVRVMVSNKEEDIKKADYLVLLGVGAFAEGMGSLKKSNLINILNKEVIENKKPILGICLGMQLMTKESDENGNHKGLGWLDAEVKLFKLKDKNLKVPHVGWNNIKFKESCSLFNDIEQDSVFYFVHSHYVSTGKEDIKVATCNYGINFVSAIQQDNIFATQFHPEKSQTVGLKLLENFLNSKSN